MSAGAQSLEDRATEEEDKLLLPLATAMDNTMSRTMQGLRGSQLIWVARCSTTYDTLAFNASRIQAVCRTAHWAVG